MSTDDFSITIRPLRTGFMRDGHFYRLWEGKTSLGQEVVMIGFGLMCEGNKVEGADYTPIDKTNLPELPEDVYERMRLAGELVSAAKGGDHG